jgi:hypothetical protein
MSGDGGRQPRAGRGNSGGMEKPAASTAAANTQIT